MTSNEILKADMLDILFDNRNKLYGAYALRKNYNRRLVVALGISLSMAALLFLLIPKNSSSKYLRNVDAGTVIIKQVEFPKELKEIQPPPAKRVETIYREKKFTRLVIVNKDNVNDPPAITELEHSMISNRTKEGIEVNGEIAVVKPPAAVVPEKEIPKNDQVEILPSREPEFPGGVEAWLKFLQRNLVAPAELQAGETKTVSIRFYVSTDGVVTNFEVLKSAGKTFDDEVIRVLKRMPRWKPAIQNGVAVARAFTQPVTFMGVE